MNVRQAGSPLLALIVVVLGCSKETSVSDRAADCARVRRIIDDALAGAPRRYRDRAIREGHAHDRLARLAYRDPVLRAAALDPEVTYDKLDQLCTPAATGRERDCAEVRRVLTQPFAVPRPSGSDEAAIFDPGLLDQLARFPFSTPEVRDAVLALNRAAPAMFYSGSQTQPDMSPLERVTTLCHVSH